MKKRTSLVCFLIFTLCVFYTAIPNTVFGQEEASLAEQVIENHGETLMRPQVQGGFLIVLGILEKNPSLAAALNATTIELVINGTLSLDTLIDRDTLTAEQAAALDQFLPLLEAKDEGVLALLRDPQVLEALKDPEAVSELAKLLTPPDDGTTPPDDGTTPPDDGTTPPDDGTTPPDDGTTPPDDGTTPPDDGTTPPDDGTTPPDDGTTPPDDGTTPPDDGTTPPDDGTTPPDDGTTPPVPGVEAEPFAPIMPTNQSILGKSRLGGLSMNRISGQKFARDLAGFLGFDPVLLPIAIDAIPKGILSKQQKEGLKFFFNNPDVPIFAGKLGDKDLAQGLDPENFGNAITPMLLDLLYDDGMGDRTDPNRKYLTRDNLHVYVRVPSVDIDGVTFELSNGERKEGERAVDPAVFGSETIPYNFRLEEALAATNLPAWPGIVDENTSIFESVTLRYSTEGLNGRYTGYEMHRVLGPNGIVWETGDSVDITPGNNYYYFDVTLTDAVTLEILDLSKIEELRSPTLSQILDATTTYTIKKWSMPDPRNLQLADRGILERLIDDEVKAELNKLAPVLLASLANEQIPSGRELGKLQNILQRNAYKVLTQFTDAFDPQLSSVFSVPKIDTTSESIWVTEFTDIPEGNYFLGATVYDADGNLDRMQGEFTVDTEAPKADVEIAAENAIEMSAHNATNTAGYQNREGVYVATALEPGAATLNIMGNPTSGRVEEGYGYLIYQIIGLDPSGDPYIGDPSLQRPNTWMPLTIESTMLASVVWDQLKEQLTRQGIEIPSTINLPLEAIQGFLGALREPGGGAGLAAVAPQLNATLKAIGDVLGVRLQLEDDRTSKLLADVLGSAINIVNAVPITYGDNTYGGNNVQMPIQGEKMSLLKGHYGIRAMGIDTLFNVSSHTPPTRLQIIEQEGQHDQVVVTAVSIGDRNGDGIVGNRWWESGHIFANTTEGVMLTLKHEKIAHLIDHENASVVVQYMGAGGQWQDIPSDDLLSALESSGTASVTWDVTDFDALVAAGNTVKVRAVATNALTIEDPDPMTFEINLDPGVHPVDPEVLALAVDESTITATNPDSGAPQGTFTIDAYTPQRTSLEIESLRLEIEGGEYADWTDLGVSSVKGDLVSDTKASDLVEAAMQEKVASDTYQYWSFTVDTTQLADTITMDTLEVAHALATGATDENMYSVRAIAVLSDGSDDVEDPAEQPMDSFSVDNVDDVGPLGPTNLVVSGVDAFEDTAVFVDNGDGTYTVGGLVDIYDDGVNPPAATFTIKPTAKRTTYETIEIEGKSSST